MSDRVLGWTARSSLVLGLVLAGVTLWLGLTRDTPAGLASFVGDVHWFLSFVMFLPVGTLVARRHPRNPVGWLLVVIGLSEVIASFTYEYAARALVIDPGSLPAGDAMAWLSGWTWAPGLCLFPFLMLLFPTGHALSRRWSVVGWIPVAWMAAFFVFSVAVWPYRGPAILNATGSFNVPQLAAFEDAVMRFVPTVLLALGVSLVSVVVRFRRSRGTERQQLKWIAFTAALGATNLIVADFVLSPLGLENRAVVVIGETLGGPGLFAIAAAVAMLRYRLYEIDVIINRTLVYGLLSAVLAGAYVGLVFGFQALLAPFTAESDLAIAASTLAVAALFRPARSSVQDFIDRRFYRRKVDAQSTLDEFSSSLRDEVDLDALSSELIRVVGETMQPSQVTLWLRQGMQT